MSYSAIHPIFKCNQRLGKDTFFYGIENARLIYSNNKLTELKSFGSGEITDRRGVVLENSSKEIILSSFLRNDQLRSSYIKQIKSLSAKTNKIVMPGTSFFCGDRFTDGNMCHVVLDHLIRAWQCKESMIDIDQYIFYESTWPWAKQIIETVLPSSKIVYIRDLRCIHFEKVYFCANSFGGPGTAFAQTGMLGLSLKHPACLANRRFLKQLQRSCIGLMRTKIADSKNRDFPKLIFISRKGKSRRFNNQEAIEKMMQSYQYDTAFLEEISIQRQLEIFHNAKIIVGFHGAGLTNLIACKEKTKIIEIFGRTGSSAYAELSQSLNLNYQHLNLIDLNSQPRIEWEADIKKLKACLEQLRA